MELVHAPQHHPLVETHLLVVNGSDYTKLALIDGVLGAYRWVSGAGTTLGTVPYDAALHRWLRIREANGTVFYEMSPDGASWTLLATSDDLFDLSAVFLQIRASTYGAVASPGLAVFDNFNVQGTSLARRVEERRRSARDVRVEAAELAAARPHDEHVNNNDEVNYAGRPFIGSYSKSLGHDELGDPDPASYATLLRALQSEDPADFEEIILGSPTAKKLTNPQAGLAFDVEGPDAQERTIPPAPRFDSEQTAHEMGELYWMAVLRDLPFVYYGSDGTATAAITSLNGEFPRFGGTVPVTVQNLFRGIYPGEQVGPYVSQFLLKGNVDPRKPAGQGRDATDGFISYGSRVIDQRLFPATSGVDHLTSFATWLDVQNGADRRGMETFDTTSRFILNLRAGATFVHFDQVLDAFYNAAWILMSEPTGNQLAVLTPGTGRPQVDLEFPKNAGNPYDPPGTATDSRTQVGFATFGPTHLLQALAEVMGRALRAVWWQKWGVHRRLRPEEYGGRVHNHVTGARSYPLHTSIVTSLQSGGLAPHFGQAGEQFPGTYLLPQAYPEGAPTHPAYGAGHATGSGAMVTLLKAFFDESAPIENPVQSDVTGNALVAYTGADAGQMTVGGELNKLAGNIAIFRNAAGVHWRSDYTESLPFGEAIAIGLLQEMSLGFNEDDAYFQLTKFDGQTIRIFDGKVVPVVS
ncbi:vanadium-dependent haloperoxidase [Longimicrobium sp.]|uniref:vanadium-dependent haloperoxidase n=1 Tax=Longimicrobium sp. TaxID=2029185 RepID=UPI002E2F6601|nr:vanadium-dependent haloperoxidase [Longimicrobium sp.]HEX6042577.1 vanadium-dependent haloperoxidase [Longimicrobium sp.]